MNIINTAKPPMEKLPGGWEPTFEISLQVPTDVKRKTPYGRIHIFENLLSPVECNELIKQFMQSPNFENVSIQGRKDVPDDRIGSVRTTAWCPQLAEEFWNKKLSSILKSHFSFSDVSQTDWWQGNKERKQWTPIGISPMMRFMKYEQEGQHYAHYDAGFIYPDDRYRTLYSMVIYLTSNDKGGSTRFIKDGQDDLKTWDRIHEDWTREANDDEVICKSEPIQGNVLIFPHRMCHDVEKYLGETSRIIIRTDILFEHKND